MSLPKHSWVVHLYPHWNFGNAILVPSGKNQRPSAPPFPTKFALWYEIVLIVNCTHMLKHHKQVTDTICKQVPNAVCKPVKKQKCENVPVVTCRWGNVIRMSLYPLHTALVQLFILIGKSPSPSVKLCPTKSASWYFCLVASLCQQTFSPDQVKDSVCTKIPQETCSGASKRKCQNFSVVTCRYRICWNLCTRSV